MNSIERVMRRMDELFPKGAMDAEESFNRFVNVIAFFILFGYFDSIFRLSGGSYDGVLIFLVAIDCLAL